MDDGLQIKIAVTCLIISLVVAVMTPVIVPDASDGDEDSAMTLASARSQLTSYTGESMLTMSPWVLHDVRTPYTANKQVNTASDYGWVYGSISNSYVYNGTEYVGKSIVRLDPAQTSDTRLDVGSAAYIDLDNRNDGLFGWLVNWWNEMWNNTKVYEANAFEFTGLLYNFSPTAKINTSGSWNTQEMEDLGSLNIVWYKTGYGSGISSGLVLYSDKNHAVIRDYSSSDIISAISNDQYATKYYLNYEGVKTYMYIQFDTDVLAQGMSKQQAWNDGKWTIAFVSPSADNLINLGSGSASFNVGQIIDTYKNIMTFDMPGNMPMGWMIVLWIICIIPLTMAMLFFFLRILEAILTAVAGVVP